MILTITDNDSKTNHIDTSKIKAFEFRKLESSGIIFKFIIKFTNSTLVFDKPTLYTIQDSNEVLKEKVNFEEFTKELKWLIMHGDGAVMYIKRKLNSIKRRLVKILINITESVRFSG